MKTITRIIASLSFLAALAACQQFEIDTQMTPEKEAANLRLVCDAVDSYQVASTDADNITFNVSANTPWTITRSSGADWCTVTPSSSSSSSLIADVVVSVADNPAGEERSATLTVTGERINKTYTIKVTQDRKGRLFVTPVAKDYAATGGPLNFTVNTNVPWEVRSDVSWLSFNRESGQPDPDGKTFTIIATAEPSDVLERTATVTVIAGNDEESFEVTQKGTFEITEITGDFPGSGGSQTLKLRTDLPWTVSVDKDWITFDPEEGTGDGSVTYITVTAAPNEDTARKASITVTAGGVDKTFEVSQGGATFEIVPPADPAIDRKGGELVLEVHSSLAWEPATEVEGWTVEKVDDSHLKVTAPYNGKFAEKKGLVSINGTGGATVGVELTQDVNFTFEGNCEVQADGSVKLTGGAATRVKTKDEYRYLKINLEMGECHFASQGELWFTGQVGSANIYNQLTVDGKTRTRTDGNADDGTSTYKSTYFTITLDELNSMTSYGVSLTPTADDPALLHFEFLYNGEVRGQQDGPSAFNSTEAGTAYWFGFWNAGTADTWYVVKSCEIIPVEG